MEIIINNTDEQLELRYTPTITDNSLNWFQIEANKSISNNTSIWNNSIWNNKGVNGVYNTITPLTIASYASIDQSKQEPILAKLIQVSNGEDRNIMYIIGNRQLKAMQENGTIRAIGKNPLSVYNSIGLCGKRTQNLNQYIYTTYTDEHGDTRYYWQDYGEFTIKGFKWSVKSLLNEFYIKVSDDLQDINIYTPTNTFPYSNSPTTQKIVVSGDNSASGYAGFTIKNRFTCNTANNEILNITTESYQLFRTQNQGAYRVELYGICLGYDVTMVINTDVDLCLFRLSKYYGEEFTSDDYIGGYGVITETDDEGVVTIKKTGTSITGREIDIKATDIFILIPIQTMFRLVNGGNIQGYIPDIATYNNTIAKSPYNANAHIYDFLPNIDILQLLRIYQFALNQDITIDESTLQTSIIPVPTQMRYYPIIDYTQKFDTFGNFKAKSNVIKIEGDNNNEETTILDVNLSNANVVELEDIAEIVTLPSRVYFSDININTHTPKTFTRCYEVVISINYADFKDNLSYISFFGQKARVLSGQYDNENQTAKLIILI